LRLTASYYPAPRRLEETAAMAGIGDLLRRPYAKLSGGQQRCVQFALAVCGRPELLFLDEPTVGMDIEARRRIGVMLQSAELPPTLRVGELLRLTASYYPAPRSAEEAAAMAGIGDLLKRPYAKLSGGQQRRVQFALALCGRPELLFLDEPTVGLDIDARRKLWAAIRHLVAEGCSVLLTTHYLEEAEALADRVCVMTRGRVIHQGTVDALRARVALRRIRCLSTLSIDALRAWPEIADVQQENGRLHITAADAEAVVRHLLAADPQLRELEVQRAGLAEAFTELTREAGEALPEARREVA
jgi:ABC-2 type transport system ATP-binding protein